MPHMYQFFQRVLCVLCVSRLVCFLAISALLCHFPWTTFSIFCSIVGIWILLVKMGHYLEKETWEKVEILVVGRYQCTFCCSLGHSSMICCWPTTFVDIRAHIMTLTGFFFLAWIQSGCTSFPMRHLSRFSPFTTKYR